MEAGLTTLEPPSCKTLQIVFRKLTAEKVDMSRSSTHSSMVNLNEARFDSTCSTELM